MAGGGLKIKPIRLIFTILLSVVAFTVFGMTSTLMMYDPNYSIATAMEKSNYQSAVLTKEYSAQEIMIEKLDNGEDRITRSQDVKLKAGLTKAEIDKFNENNNGLVFSGLMDLGYYEHTDLSVGGYTSPNLQFDSVYITPDFGWYYTLSAINGYSDCGHQALIDNGFSLIAGEYPENYSEIAIPNYIYEMLRDSYVNNDIYANYDHAEKILGVTLKIAGITFSISGVYNVGEIPEHYEVLRAKESGLTYYEKQELSKEFADYLTSSFHKVCFVSQDFYEQYKYKYLVLGERVLYGVENSSYDIESKVERVATCTVYTLESVSPYEDSVKAYGIDGKTPFDISGLKSDECLIPGQRILSYWSNEFYRKVYNDPTLKEEYSDFIDAHERYKNSCATIEDSILMYSTLISDMEKVTGYEVYVSDEHYAKNAENKYETLKVKGVYFISAGGTGSPDKIFVSNEFCNQITLAPKKSAYSNSDLSMIKTDYKINASLERYGKIITLSDNTLDQTYFMLKSGGNGVSYKLVNLVYETSHRMAEMFSDLKPFFLIAGGVFGLFASLMLFNFISVGIENKKKEIGILRAVGARGLDVFKIFIIEALLITMLCLILSLVASSLLCTVVNASATQSFLMISFLNFGLINALILTGISATIAFIATVLPVGRYVKRSPVESIRAL